MPPRLRGAPVPEKRRGPTALVRERLEAQARSWRVVFRWIESDLAGRTGCAQVCVSRRARGPRSKRSECEVEGERRGRRRECVAAGYIRGPCAGRSAVRAACRRRITQGREGGTKRLQEQRRAVICMRFRGNSAGFWRAGADFITLHSSFCLNYEASPSLFAAVEPNILISFSNAFILPNISI